MRKLVIGLVVIAGMLLLSGCSGKSPNMHKRGTQVTKVEGRHYVIPKPSYSTKWKRLSKSEAKGQNRSSKNTMKCRAGDIVVDAEKDTTRKYLKDVFSDITVKEAKAERTKGRKLKKKERLEIADTSFKETFVKYVQQGKTMCIHPQPWSWTKQRNRYEAQQARINNDPRVIAARIQANAINNAAYANQLNYSPGIKPYVAPTYNSNFLNEKLTTTSTQSGSTSYSVRPMGSDHYRVTERRTAPKW